MVRADKARNQETVLAAAGRLFDAANDPDEVSMDAVAAAAGVGKGTIFRGFGDRVGLIRALYDQRMTAFEAVPRQDETLGAEAQDAAQAVYTHLIRLWQFKRRNRMLSLALDRAGYGSPYANDSYERAHAEILRLLSETDEREDAAFLAHALLAAVRSDLVEHLRDVPAAEVEAGLHTLTRRLLS